MDDKSDDTSQRTIDVNDPDQMHAWAKSLSVTHEQLAGAVAQVGDSADKVAAFLARNKLVEADAALHVHPH